MEYKFLSINDMAKIECNDCRGCSECCHDMGQSIILDPYDVMRLSNYLRQSFNELMQSHIEVHMEEGLIMPNLRMTSDSDPRCTFLDAAGRCSIHEGRPGLCRLFPLGRDYSDGLKYFVLENACPASQKTKIKIKKWVGPESSSQYQQYLQSWHSFVKAARKEILDNLKNDSFIQKRSMDFLTNFYVQPYNEESFFEEIKERMQSYF